MNQGNFDKEREVAIKQMIEEKKREWDQVDQKRQSIKDEIGKLMAKIEFWEALAKDKTPTYSGTVANLEQLKEKYNNHVEENKELAERLDKEINILNGLL